MDIMFSLILLILFLPIFIPIILLLILTAQGEVLYFQERLGYKNKLFQISQSATMVKISLQMDQSRQRSGHRYQLGKAN